VTHVLVDPPYRDMMLGLLASSDEYELLYDDGDWLVYRVAPGDDALAGGRR